MKKVGQESNCHKLILFKDCCCKFLENCVEVKSHPRFRNDFDANVIAVLKVISSLALSLTVFEYK